MLRPLLVTEVPPLLEAVTHDPFIDEPVSADGSLSDVVISSMSHSDRRPPARRQSASR
jgi:hypothetical protein